MDLKKLEYLESVYRLGSFTKAAQEHYISQPSITKAINSLESELKIQLIQRTTKNITFTSEGLLFMKHVHRILTDVRQAEEEMRECREQQDYSLRLAISTTAGDWLIPRVYSDFLTQYPKAQVDISETSQDQIIHDLIHGSLDLAYTILPKDYDKNHLDILPITQGELVLLMPKGHPLEQFRRVPFSLLDQERILAFPVGTFIRSCTDKECERFQISPKLSMASPQMNITYHAVEHGGGLTIITNDHMSDSINTDRLSLRGFAEPITFDEGFLLKKGKHKSVVMRQFIAYVKNFVEKV